jgi:adenylosuccinate synthase
MTHAPIEPQYKTFKGWNKETTSIKEQGDLPVEMNDYISFINAALAVEVRYISNGPGRDQIIKVQTEK